MRWLDKNRPLIPALDDMALVMSSSFFSDNAGSPRDLLQRLTNAEREARWRDRLAIAVLKDRITEDEITANLKRAQVLRQRMAPNAAAIVNEVLQSAKVAS